MTKKKVTVVTVGAMVSRYNRQPDDPPQEVCGRYHQEGASGPWIREIKGRSDAYLSGEGLPDFMAKLRNSILEAGLDPEKARIDLEHDYQSNYGDCEYGVEFRGERPATPEEIVWVKKDSQVQAEYAKENIRARARQLQEEQKRLEREHPELFK